MLPTQQEDDILTLDAEKDTMTRADAGRLGGETTKQRHGNSGFYSQIGQKGGRARGNHRP